MGKVDFNRNYGTVHGIVESGARFTQDGKRFNGQGIEIDDIGDIVDPGDLIPAEPLEEVPAPINGKEYEFDSGWDSEKDAPSGYVGLSHDGFKNGEPEENVSGSKCDVCGFVAKSDFGLRSHKRYKHSK